jgi:hypothetical protein
MQTGQGPHLLRVPPRARRRCALRPHSPVLDPRAHPAQTHCTHESAQRACWPRVLSVAASGCAACLCVVCVCPRACCSVRGVRVGACSTACCTCGSFVSVCGCRGSLLSVHSLLELLPSRKLQRLKRIQVSRPLAPFEEAMRGVSRRQTLCAAGRFEC